MTGICSDVAIVRYFDQVATTVVPFITDHRCSIGRMLGIQSGISPVRSKPPCFAARRRLRRRGGVMPIARHA